MSANLTDSDRQFLEKAIFCLRSPPELDVGKMSEVLGIKPKSVTNRWCEIKKKIYADLPASIASPAGPPSGRKRKTKAADAADGADASSPVESTTPSKKPRGRQPKKTVQEETAEINAMIKKEDQVEHEASLMASMTQAPAADNGCYVDGSV